MVLVDAGAEYKGYCGDISRTWPVDGHFSTPQQELYEAVLRVNMQCIDMITPGGMSYYKLQQASGYHHPVVLGSLASFLQLPFPLCC